MDRAPTPLWSDQVVDLFVLTPDLVGDAYVGWLNDPEIGRFLESRYAVHTLAGTRDFVADMLASEGNLFLGIRSKALDGRHVGNIKLGPINRHHETAEIGLLIGDRAAWSRGLATHAIARVADIAGAELGLRKVTAGCYAANGGSERAFAKAGFAIEGRRPAQVIGDDGRPDDLILMGRVLRAPRTEGTRA